jgi:hypothetical protein
MSSERFEPPRIQGNGFDVSDFHAQPERLQFLGEFVAINEINSACTITDGFPDGISGKVARGDEQAFIGAALHGPSEVSDLCGPDRPGVSLALEHHVKAQDTVDLGNAFAVNASIASSTGHFHLNKTGFTQYALH